MTTGKKIIIGLLLFLTIVLAGISAYVAIDLQQPSDTSVAAGYCPAITCPDGTTFPEDNNTPQATCADREAEACSTHQGTGGGTCPVGGGSCSGRPIGDVIATADGSCSCQLNSSTGLCGCVASAGTTCDIPSDDGLAGNCVGSSIGAACSRDGSQGVCQSAGVTGSDQRCRCALSGNSTPDNGNGGTDPGGQGDTNLCSTRTDCNVGYYCAITGICVAQGGNGDFCSTNDSCVSGNCDLTTNKCVIAGTTTNSCNPATNSPCTNGQICNPNTLICETPASANGDCLSDAQCASGLVCISLRCREIVDDSDPNAQCISGKWYCGATAGCTTPGTGKLCNTNSLAGQTCTVADACADLTSNGALSTGMSCDGLTRLSNGEASRGAFVGCSGRQNCFCPGTSTSVDSTVPSGNSVSCFDDIGNDSCGAGTITTTTTTPPPGGGGTSNPVCSQSCSTTCGDGTSCINGVCRNPQCPTDTDCLCDTTTTSQPYCGDAICQTGETCEAVSAGSSSYYNCTTQELISSCIGIGSSSTPSCYYCGDGIVNGSEQCDYNAPGAQNCSTSCTNISNACIDLVENGPDPIRTGTGNVVEYIIQYSNAQVGDPYPNIKLRVGPSGSPVGRDANNTGQTLVSAVAKPSSTDNGSTKTYKFVWEAASTAGSAVADGTYDVRVLTTGTEASLESVAACQESITVNSTAPQESVFTLVKSAAEVCTSNGDAQISYTIAVTNTGPVNGTINQVTDTLDQDLVSAGITPTGINPTYGSYAGGIITWVGSATDRTYTSGQTKNFTYTVTIPKSLLVSFYQQGVYNIASVTYSDNSSNFEVNTPINCNVPTKGTTGSVPSTALFSDSSHYIIFGALLILSGLAVTKMNSGRYVTELMYNLTGQTTSDSFEKKALKDVKKKDN